MKYIEALNRIREEVSESCYNDILRLIAEEYPDKVIRADKEPEEEKEQKKCCIIKKGNYKLSQKPVKI